MIGLSIYGETPLTDVTTLKETTEQDLTKLTSRERTAPTRRVTTVTIMRPKYPARPNAKFAPFRVVMDDGITLIDSTRDPEFAAARELLARGITGELQTKHEGSDTICMKLDIEKAAMRTTVENFSTSPIVQAYRPHMFEARRTIPEDDENDFVVDGAIRHFPPSPLTQRRTEVRVGL